MKELPRFIDSGCWNTGHCQGIAVDLEKGFVSYSFTTTLVKTDLQGRLVGTCLLYTSLAQHRHPV